MRHRGSVVLAVHLYRYRLPVAVYEFVASQVGVAAILDRWELTDRLWTDAPVRRSYFRLLLVNGRRLTVFYDESAGRWFEQGGWG